MDEDLRNIRALVEDILQFLRSDILSLGEFENMLLAISDSQKTSSVLFKLNQASDTIIPTSPVASHPLESIVSAVFCGSFQYPAMMLGPRITISPRGKGKSVLKYFISGISTNLTSVLNVRKATYHGRIAPILPPAR
jgi:hypothetical protein